MKILHHQQLCKQKAQLKHLKYQFIYPKRKYVYHILSLLALLSTCVHFCPVSPLMTMETILVQKGGKDFQEVICTAAGGRPHPNITWMLPQPKHSAHLQRNISKLDTVASSYLFPSDLYEGENITCIFEYTLLPFKSTRTVTLPIYCEYKHEKHKQHFSNLQPL